MTKTTEQLIEENNSLIKEIQDLQSQLSALTDCIRYDPYNKGLVATFPIQITNGGDDA